jgi:hypothetical protein
MCVEEKNEIRLEFDCSLAFDQIHDLVTLALARFPEKIPDQLVSDILGMSSDLILGDFVTAVRADGSLKITCPCRLGGSFESLTAALRTSERDWIGHLSSPRIEQST